MSEAAVSRDAGPVRDGALEQARPYRIVILVFCWLAAATVYFSFCCVAPLSPMIIQSLGISRAAMGLLFSSPLFTFAIFAFVGGALSDKLGPRVIIGVGISLIALCGIARGAFHSSYPALLVLNLLLGVGIGLSLPNLPKLTAGWFPPAQRAWATSVYSTGIACGSSGGLFLTMPVAFPLAGRTWHQVFYVWGALALLVAVLMWLLIRNYPGYQTPARSATLFDAAVYSNKTIWLVAAAFFWACWLFFSVIGWIPTIMKTKGVSATAGGAMAALVPITGLVAMLVAPTLSNKLRRRVIFIWGSYAVGLLVVLAMIFSPISGFWLLLSLTGLIINTPFVIAVFVIPVDMIPRERLGAATGLIMTVGYIAALLGPWVSGAIWDMTGSVTGVMISLIIAYAIGIVISLFIPESYQGEKVVNVKPTSLAAAAK